MSQENALLEIAKSGFTGETLRVLLVLLAKVEYENFIVVSQSDMAEELGVSKTQFNRSLKILIDNDIIQRGPKVGRQGSLRLNPNYGWKGTAKNHIIALDSVRKKT